MKKIYQSSLEEVYNFSNSSLKGLSSVEAEKRQKEYGKNILEEKKKKNPFLIFLRQFNNMMILLLILVGIVSLVYSIVNNESVVEAIVIFSCVIINALMGFFQEMKSENAIDSLKTLTASKVKVKRDGSWIVIDTAQLVIGDIISLEAGDKVPADCRIISCVNAKVDESILTGESIAVEKNNEIISKDALIQDRTNMIFSGTNVANGRIEAIVVATGMNTEIGAIARDLDKKEVALTPLQVKVSKVSKFITAVASILMQILMHF